jgi:hypothetical protein
MRYQKKVISACTTGSFFIALLTNRSSDRIKKDELVRERGNEREEEREREGDEEHIAH